MKCIPTYGVEVSWKSRQNEGGETRDTSELDGEKMGRLLVVVTTNEERQLPPAFLRRCIVHNLRYPDADRLVRIAGLHFKRVGKSLSDAEDAEDPEVKVSHEIAEYGVRLRKEAEAEAQRPPSTAEYLDAVRACFTLKIEVSEDKNSEWMALERATLLKTEPVEDENEDEEGGDGGA